MFYNGAVDIDKVSKGGLNFRQSGFTLMEVLITIVVLSIAAVSMMSVFVNTVKTSASPIIQHQAAAIAEAYMEEIQLKAFEDPTGDNTGESRSTYDDIQDYNLLTEVATDQSGTPIVGLSAYTVAVSVTGQALVGTSTTIAGTDSMLIKVSVSHAAIETVSIAGFRTKF